MRVAKRAKNIENAKFYGVFYLQQSSYQSPVSSLRQRRFTTEAPRTQSFIQVLWRRYSAATNDENIENVAIVATTFTTFQRDMMLFMLLLLLRIRLFVANVVSVGIVSKPFHWHLAKLAAISAMATVYFVPDLPTPSFVKFPYRWNSFLQFNVHFYFRTKILCWSSGFG